MNSHIDVITALEQLKQKGRIRPNDQLVVRGLEVGIRVDGILQPLAILPRIAEVTQSQKDTN